MLILQRFGVILDPAFSTYKLVLYQMTSWALLNCSYLLHYFPAVLCINDGWFMLLFLSYYFVGTALCNKATPSPQGSTYCAEAAFLAFSDTSCPFLHIPFIFIFAHGTFLLSTPSLSWRIPWGLWQPIQTKSMEQALLLFQ